METTRFVAAAWHHSPVIVWQQQVGSRTVGAYLCSNSCMDFLGEIPPPLTLPGNKVLSIPKML